MVMGMQNCQILVADLILCSCSFALSSKTVNFYVLGQKALLWKINSIWVWWLKITLSYVMKCSSINFCFLCFPRHSFSDSYSHVKFQFPLNLCMPSEDCFPAAIFEVASGNWFWGVLKGQDIIYLIGCIFTGRGMCERFSASTVKTFRPALGSIHLDLLYMCRDFLTCLRHKNVLN